MDNPCKTCSDGPEPCQYRDWCEEYKTYTHNQNVAVVNSIPVWECEV